MTLEKIEAKIEFQRHFDLSQLIFLCIYIVEQIISALTSCIAPDVIGFMK